jgi:hypothetical protein
MGEPWKPRNGSPRETDCGSFGSAEPLAIRRRPTSTSLRWNLSMFELPGVVGDGMPGRNGQRKTGTARGLPTRSRTAKAVRISRRAVKSRCAREWGAWGRLSEDGSRQHNSNRSEGPWGRWGNHRMAVHYRAHGQYGVTDVHLRLGSFRRGWRCGYASGMRAPDPDRTPAAKLCSMCKPDRGCVRMLVPSLSRAAAPVLTRLAQSVNAIALASWSFRSANFCPALRSTIPAAPICGERAQVLVWLEVRGEGWSETADERKSHSAHCPV